MAFLFKSKKPPPSATPSATRNGQSPSSSNSGMPNVNGVVGTRDREKETALNHSITPNSSVNTSVNSVGGAGTPSPEQKSLRDRPDYEPQHAPRNTSAVSPSSNPNASLYPWSQRRLNYTRSHSDSNPFPRYGAAVNSVSSKEGDVYLMGGLINGSTVKGDLWMVEAGVGNLACYPVATTAEGPGPRVGHAALLVGNAFIVYGGDTKMDDKDTLDDTLYLLNTSTRQWSRAIPPGPRPAGRYGHTLNILGSKIYIFGGQVEGYFFNDLVAFDLNALQVTNNRWEMLILSSNDGGPPPGQIPPARTNHTVISWNDKLYLFGGTNGAQWFNDVWAYDPRSNTWSQLDCIGYIPAAREGHAAALVNDVMYIFGGRTEDGNDLGDLAAFRISSRRWYTFQNMGPSPSPRSGHSMTAYGKQIVVLAGEPSSAPRDPGELRMVYLLDTAKIRYPNDQQIQQTPSGERVQGNRRPSGGEKSGLPQSRSATPRDLSNGIPPEGPRRIAPAPRESVVGGANTSGGNARNADPNVMSGPVPAPGPGGPGSRLPRITTPQGPPGPPPQQQAAPPPRTNGVIPASLGSRSKTPTRAEMGHGPPLDTARAASFEKENSSPGNRAMSPIARESPSAREISPIMNGRRTPTQQQPSRIGMRSREADVVSPIAESQPRSGSRQVRQQGSIDSIDNVPASQPSHERQYQPKSDEPISQSPERAEPPTDEYQHTPYPSDPEMARVPTGTEHQSEALKQELDAAKSRNAWYASELALARKAGYQPNASSSPILDERAAESFADDDRPLIESLLAMRAELAKVQDSVDSQTSLAAKKIAEVEQQRDAAVNEAVYAKAKLAAHGGSQMSTPQLDSSSRDVDDVDMDRSSEVNRKLASSLAAQNELRMKLDAVTAEHQVEQRARQLAEEALNATHQRVSELESYKQQNSSEVESLRAELHQAQKIAREESAQSTEASTASRLLKAEKDELIAKLEVAMRNSRDHSNTLGMLRDAVVASTDKSSLLERNLEDERRQRDEMERKLLQLRGEHEEKIAELEATTGRLKDAEELAESHAAEARTHRQAVLSGLERASSKDLDSIDERATDERVTILQQQAETANALVRSNQAAADEASDKLRRAEERIAGLETYQEQTSREGLNLRRQLQNAIRETQSLQAQHTEIKQQLSSQQMDANALAVQHGALKDLLAERGITSVDGRRSRSPGSPYSATENSRLRELEQQLDSSVKAHEETKASYEQREQEAHKVYGEKLEQLENDYQSAVHYVKGTEKMLKRLKDELSKYKQQNVRLQAEVENLQKTNTSRDLEQGAPAEWEHERQSLQHENDQLRSNIKNSVAQLERQMQEVRAELDAAQEERDHYRESHDQAQRHLANTNQQARADIEQLKEENANLEARAIDAEHKVSLLLDRVESTMDDCRRQSQQLASNGSLGHHRGLSGNTNVDGSANRESIQDSVYGPDNRTSLALDSLASELDALRTHWETTNKNYRLSSQFDFEKTPTSAHGELSDSLASWRKRLDLEENEADERKDTRYVNDEPPMRGEASPAMGGHTHQHHQQEHPGMI
ncbi:MAG: Negative regulator of mitotic exit [Candelina mexicana]|nr:MAG: Negative regulator of mitotic exit [Candelina mexicana]